eukprot:gene28465-62383_t
MGTARHPRLLLRRRIVSTVADPGGLRADSHALEWRRAELRDAARGSLRAELPNVATRGSLRVELSVRVTGGSRELSILATGGSFRTELSA